MKKLLLNLAFIVGGAVMLTASTACDKNGHLNVLSVDDDKKLGAQTAAQIDSMSSQYPILDRAQYPQAYAYLENMKNQILNSGELTYKDDFVWQMHIIKDDSTLNAFCTPGGYIYVYSGIIKYLDTADYLAGVIGHEMGHADLRHTSRQITEQQGYDVVIQALTGGSQIGAIASQIIQLKYSRGYETEADQASVRYLSKTSYACDGGKYFFLKLTKNNQGSQTPVFLSDHPGDATRIQTFQTEAKNRNCGGNFIRETGTTYQQFKASLP